MAVSLKSLKQYLMGRIDEQDISQVEKVERYIELKKMMNRLIKQVAKDGDTMVTQNGSQSFTKAHPLINDINKLNTQLLNIEKSFIWKKEQKQSRPKLL
ncbi:hypothetical protein NHG34_05280 [Aerococcaceae bacterium NML190938]|nr:hypothetical protein [Aerococcaceae bacterium NML190938]